MFLCPPSRGQEYNLPVGAGFIGAKLLPTTKTSCITQADVVIPWDTAGGLVPGVWFSRLVNLGSQLRLYQRNTTLFVKRLTERPIRARDYLHQHLLPLLRLQMDTDPYLSRYIESDPEMCLSNNVRFHNLRLSGRTSCTTGDGGMRKCTPGEADMHGRWRTGHTHTESASARYEQPPFNVRVQWLVVCF